ncbi:hypothetical protein FACS189421_11370 [Bacteroidia bacterium]|nr:hypothetical protein FACS189421_11370 [Bacteroidia bacterium]GHT46013.1 hypothetical protein FACS189440_03120 [Bacteroidia bacterium]
MQLQTIQNKICELREQRVMFDFDLAELYEIETKRLKEAVRRNIKRFPPDFLIELTNEEWENLRSQIASSKRGGTRYSPFAFTEQGVAMLSSVLNSDKAIEVNISIMRAFVLMRQYALSHRDLTEKLKQLEEKYDQQFSDIHEAMNYLLQKDKQEIAHRERKRIGFNVD